MNPMHIIFDMDGVLAKYERSAYIGENPAYLQPSYFCNLQPDDRMVNVVSTLSQSCDPTRVQIFIKTTASSYNGDIMLQQYRDKKEWLNKYCYGIDLDTNFIMLPHNSKPVGIAIPELCFPNINGILATLTYQDILIDDFNRNLNDWSMHGGLGLKYVNGVNSPNSENSRITFDGMHITPHMSSSDIIELLLSFSPHKNNYKKIKQR